MAGTLNDPGVIRKVVGERGRVAVVGLSSEEMRESHRVARFLLDHGYDIVPINPKETEILGRRCFANLGDVPGRIDCVNVFRRPEAVGHVIEEAIARGGIPVVWMQLGIVNYEAADRAQAAGIHVVMDHCLKVETARHDSESAGAAP